MRSSRSRSLHRSRYVRWGGEGVVTEMIDREVMSGSEPSCEWTDAHKDREVQTTYL